MRGTFVEVHIADIHFGAFDPKVQLNILREQFLNKILLLPMIHIISINGDLFDRKYMANSEVITCANQFMYELICICKKYNASILLIHGTESHDAHQFNLFYQYLDDKTIDFRIIETMQYQWIKGKTVLCIPEESNKGYEYYASMFRERDYDACYMHGTFVNSIPGFDHEDLDSEKRPTFDINNFWRCNGPIISGHVHVAQCYKRHFYYSGSPMRWMFGEEQPKGFLILCHNLDTGEYIVRNEEIVSFQYVTIDLDNLLMTDPKEIIHYLEGLKESGIDYIKLKIKKYIDAVPIIKEYFRSKEWMTISDKIKAETILKANEEALNKYKGLEFLTDPNIDDYTKFVMYVNSQEGEGFLTIEKLKELLKDD